MFTFHFVSLLLLYAATNVDVWLPATRSTDALRMTCQVETLCDYCMNFGRFWLLLPTMHYWPSSRAQQASRCSAPSPLLLLTVCLLAWLTSDSAHRYFQLLQVRIPSDVGQQFLSNIILNENAEQEQFAQDAAVETLTIERDVQDIMNQATELREAALANATLTRSIAQANVSVCVFVCVCVCGDLIIWSADALITGTFRNLCSIRRKKQHSSNDILSLHLLSSPSFPQLPLFFPSPIPHPPSALPRSISSQAAATIEDARTRGLALLIERLNITEGRHKASLDYIRTLRRTAGNVRLHVGFRDTISGPYNGQNV